MAVERRPPFDPKAFLAMVGEGRSIGRYRKGEIVVSQGDPADAVFYIERGEKRLARLLLLLANFGKEEKPEPILAKISQETLADMIGTTRSRVSAYRDLSTLILPRGHVDRIRGSPDVSISAQPSKSIQERECGDCHIHQ